MSHNHQHRIGSEADRNKIITQDIFSAGYVTMVMGSQYGSEAKGCVSALLTKVGRPDFLITANGRNSSHTVYDPEIRPERVVLKVLPAGAFYWGTNQYTPTIFIGPGAAFTVEDLKKETDLLRIPRSHVSIHPLASIVTEDDINFENGLCDFEGKPIERDDSLSMTGTTGSGAGAARAKKSLRRGLVARDCPEVWEYATECWNVIPGVAKSNGALLDGSQGYLLSNYGKHWPHATSRSTSAAAFMSECCLPPGLLHSVVGVARTFPIRINSKRYFHTVKGKFLVQDEVDNETDKSLIQVIDGNSGNWESDQQETTWEAVGVEPELTSLTKLPRRIATFSAKAWGDFSLHNWVPGGVYLFLTFSNYASPSELSGIIESTNEYRAENVFVNWGPETESAGLLK